MARWPEPHLAGAPQALAAALLQAHRAGGADLVAGHDDPCGLAPAPTAYRVAWIELTVQGFALRRRDGWGGRHEIVFTLRRPSFWQRLLRRAQPLACTLRAAGDGVVIAFAPPVRAPQRGVRNRHRAPGART